MAQDFERYGDQDVGTSASTIHTSDSDDAIISIRLASTVRHGKFVKCLDVCCRCN
jgi:hypothetical protein